jgi:hypothetical protein
MMHSKLGLKQSLDLSNHELLDDDATIVVEEVNESLEIEGGGEGLNDAEWEHEGHVSTSILYKIESSSCCRCFGGEKQGISIEKKKEKVERRFLRPSAEEPGQLRQAVRHRRQTTLKMCQQL